MMSRYDASDCLLVNSKLEINDLCMLSCYGFTDFSCGENYYKIIEKVIDSENGVFYVPLTPSLSIIFMFVGSLLYA